MEAEIRDGKQKYEADAANWLEFWPASDFPLGAEPDLGLMDGLEEHSDAHLSHAQMPSMPPRLSGASGMPHAEHHQVRWGGGQWTGTGVSARAQLGPGPHFPVGLVAACSWQCLQQMKPI
jgi:hypothetical protein